MAPAEFTCGAPRQSGVRPISRLLAPLSFCLAVTIWFGIGSLALAADENNADPAAAPSNQRTVKNRIKLPLIKKPLRRRSGKDF